VTEDKTIVVKVELPSWIGERIVSSLTSLSQEISEASDSDNLDRDFTHLLNRGIHLLGYDDKEAAEMFDVSQPTLNRWRQGTVPPVAGLVLDFLQESVRQRIAQLEEMAGKNEKRV